MGGSVQGVLGSKLDVDVGASLWVQNSLGTDVEQWADLLEERGGGQLSVVDGQSNGVGASGVAEGDSVTGDSGGRDVVTDLGTTNKALVGQGQVTHERWALQQVEGTSGGEEWLDEAEVQLGGLGGAWHESGGELGLEAWGQLGQLDLGVQSVGGGPALGQGQTGSLVGDLGLDVGGDGVVLWRALTLHGERDTVGSGGLDVHGGGGAVIEVAVQQTVDVLGNVAKERGGHGACVGRRMLCACGSGEACVRACAHNPIPLYTCFRRFFFPSFVYTCARPIVE